MANGIAHNSSIIETNDRKLSDAKVSLEGECRRAFKEKLTVTITTSVVVRSGQAIKVTQVTDKLID